MNTLYWLFGYECQQTNLNIPQDHQALMYHVVSEITRFDKTKLKSNKRIEKDIFQDILLFDKKRLKPIPVMIDEPEYDSTSSTDSEFMDGNSLTYEYDWRIPYMYDTNYIINEFIKDICL